MNRFLLTLLAMLLAIHGFGQTGMSDGRSTDKYYVVVAVIVIIFVGLFAYLFAVDRKISKFERKSKRPADSAGKPD